MEVMMPFNPDAHHRPSIRLNGYDYTQNGAYFVTICVQNRLCLFGDVAEGEMRLNTLGCVVEEEWLKTPTLRPYVVLDGYVVMPNHFHAILFISRDESDDLVGAQRAAPLQSPTGVRYPDGSIPNVKPGSLGAIVRSFKSAATKRINECRCTPGETVWQRNYHERIIRDEQELNDTRQYIEINPARWAEDVENPAYELMGG
jgi:putative transposase